MTDLISVIRNKLADREQRSIASGRVKRQGCKVLLNDLPSRRIVVDLDKVGSLKGNQARCDFLVIVELDPNCAVLVVALEIKKGRLNGSEVTRQLQAGANLAAEWTAGHQPVEFLAVAAVGSVPKLERRELRKLKVSFRGRKHVPRIMSCGSKLVPVIDKGRL